MKPRLLFYALVLAMVFLIARTSAAPAEEPPAQVIEVDRTLQGKTVDEWHRVATRYLDMSRRRYRSIRTLVFQRSWGNHWLERAFLCIHSHEGRWSDTGDPYWGGLQMDRSFMQSYGREYVRWFGPASSWPVAVQIAVAIKAHQSGRGFGPWPNTRRMCGV